MKDKVEVSLLGQNFTVRSDKDETYVHSLASFVTRRYEELQRQTRTVSSHELALLVALNLADELFRAEESAQASRAEIRERSLQILENIDGTLAQMSGDEGQVESASEVLATSASLHESTATIKQ